MKFYRDRDINNNYYHNKICDNNLSACYLDSEDEEILFFNNGYIHNFKNAAYVTKGFKSFYLNGYFCDTSWYFTKESWRRFVKLQVFI
jgi:hypothetical protein